MECFWVYDGNEIRSHYPSDEGRFVVVPEGLNQQVKGCCEKASADGPEQRQR